MDCGGVCAPMRHLRCVRKEDIVRHVATCPGRRPDAPRTLQITLPVLQPRLLAPPCADSSGELPDGCPGWCEFSDPDPSALFYDGPKIPEVVRPGLRLPGPVRIGREIGDGGMGTVFEGWHEARRQDVAVKFLSPQWIEEPAIRGRFLTEARALSRVQSPHVVGLHEFGQYHGIPFLVMDFVRGRTLSDLLHHRLSFDDAFMIVDAMARGLAAVHDRSMVHNDIKPGNVIVGFDGQVTLVDFGLARPFASVCRLESTGFSGTPVYMAPEIVGGWVDSPSPAVDLYALGIVMFELFTGRVPFDHDDADRVFNMHMHHEPPRMRDFVPDLPQGLDDLVRWCLEKERHHRIPSAGVFVRRLAELRH